MAKKEQSAPTISPYDKPFNLELVSAEQQNRDEAGVDHRHNPLGLQLISANIAHQNKIISYARYGSVTATLKHPNYKELGLKPKINIPPDHQHSLVLATFTDLDAALSRFSNSPPINIRRFPIISPQVINGLPKNTTTLTLREAFDLEFEYYRSLAALAARNPKCPEPDYGTYAYDQYENRLYLYAPEFWHRLGLRIANGMMHRDPDRKLSWWEIDRKLYQTVVGFAGLSVGGNVLEGWLRDSGFAKTWKGCDPDITEIKNLNRLARSDTRFIVGSRADKTNQRDPSDVPRQYTKAQTTARAYQLINPYQQPYLYSGHLNPDTNFQTFLLGTKNEPKVDIFVEETDNLRFKRDSRAVCRKLRIPVFMASDFGNYSIYQFWDFKNHPDLPLGFTSDDNELDSALELALTSGDRLDFFKFIEALCGPDYQYDQGFMDWAHGRGEQPVTSLPQLGTTALAAGIGGKIIASYVLGHPIPRLIAIDHLNHTVRVRK